MKAYVITCNDSVEFVVVGTKEQAETKLNALARRHFNANRGHYEHEWLRWCPALRDGAAAKPQPKWMRTAYAYYRHRHYWAARETPFSISST